jgi:internalin A
VKEQFTKPKENYLPFEDYRRICREKGVTDAEEQARLARILHALGVILHYADDARLRDTTVLNPHWVTTGVYTLLRLKERSGTGGTLTVEEAAAALPEEPRPMVKYLMGLMRRFELCYPLDEQETRWLVPQLLDRFQPALGPEWNAADATRLRYGYKVVPEGLVPRFIVRTHPLAKAECAGATAWCCASMGPRRW